MKNEVHIIPNRFKKDECLGNGSYGIGFDLNFISYEKNRFQIFKRKLSLSRCRF